MSDNRIVGFIDVLGFTNLVGKSPDLVLKIVKLIQGHADFIRQSKSDYQFSNSVEKAARAKYKETDAEITYFSDCIVVSCNQKGVLNLVNMIKSLNRRLMDLGCVFRGAIVHGELYQKDGIVVGQALVDAYKLESEVAIYPRIIIHPEVLKIIKKEEAMWPTKVINKPFNSFVTDSDGMSFIHPFLEVTYWLENGGSYAPDEVRNKQESIGLEKLISARKEMIIEQLKGANGNLKVESKIKWLANKLNEFIVESGSNSAILTY